MVFKVNNTKTGMTNVLNGMKALEEFLQMRADLGLKTDQLEFLNRNNKPLGAVVQQMTRSTFIVKWPVVGSWKEKFVLVDGVLA